MSSGGDDACGEKGKRGETRERAAPGNERMFTGGEVSYRGNYSQPVKKLSEAVVQSIRLSVSICQLPTKLTSLLVTQSTSQSRTCS